MTTNDDTLDLDAIEARATAAYPPPWRAGVMENEGKVWAYDPDALGGPQAPPAAPADPTTAPPPATEVLDADLLEPAEAEPSPRVWLAVARPPAGARVAPAEWASEHGAILPEVRAGCVAFHVAAGAAGRVRAAAEAAGLALADCCGLCGWTADLGGDRSIADGACYDCREGAREP